MAIYESIDGMEFDTKFECEAHNDFLRNNYYDTVTLYDIFQKPIKIGKIDIDEGKTLSDLNFCMCEIFIQDKRIDLLKYFEYYLCDKYDIFIENNSTLELIMERNRYNNNDVLFLHSFYDVWMIWSEEQKRLNELKEDYQLFE